MLKLDPSILSFYISEELPYGIGAVDCLVLERQQKPVVEIFIQTRCNIVHHPESPCPLMGWDYDKINITWLPSGWHILSSVQRDRGLSGSPAQCSPAAFTRRSPSRSAVPELPAGGMSLPSTALLFCGRTVYRSPDPDVFIRRKKTLCLGYGIISY